MRTANEIKPISIARSIKPGQTIWKDVKTPHYRILSAGMSIGLLLALTHPTETSTLID